jgi:hypothetical protein
MTCAVAYADADGAVLEAFGERRPPFSPEEVVREFCALLKSHNIVEVRRDKWGGEFVVERFQQHGIKYRSTDLSIIGMHSTAIITVVILL